jgi:hypothetical protein
LNSIQLLDLLCVIEHFIYFMHSLIYVVFRLGVHQVIGLRLKRILSPLRSYYGHVLAYEQCLEHNQPTVDLSTSNLNFADKRGLICGGRGGKSSYFQNFGKGYSSSSSHHRNYRVKGHGKGPSSYS